MTLHNWFTLAFAVAMGAFIALHLSSAIVIYAGSADRRLRNVSGEKRQPQGRIAEMIGELTLLGFRRLGEAELELPDNRLLGPILRRRRRHTLWILVDEPATTAAEVVSEGPASLSTWLTDDSVVQTTHPIGQTISGKGLYASVVKSDLSETYQRQRAEIDLHAVEHGPPRGVHSMGDYLRRDADYNRRFARRYLRRVFVLRQALPAIISLALCAWLIYSSLRIGLAPQ